MIFRIRNQQLSNAFKSFYDINFSSSLRTIDSYSSKSINSLRLNNKDQQSYHQRLTFRSTFYYRSQQKFIDFRKDYYEILGVPENASFQEIKQKFYHLAKEYHPDKNKGNQQKFKEINQAYNVLSQTHLRKEYDENKFSESDDPEQDNTFKDQTAGKGSLNYGAYSQLSRAEWARYRSGFMKHNTVDYSNYQSNFSVEINEELDLKKKEQWNRAYRSITIDQIKEETQFREKIFKKYCEDAQKHQDVRQKYIEDKLQEVGNRIERILGKKVRSIYDKFIAK